MHFLQTHSGYDGNFVKLDETKNILKHLVVEENFLCHLEKFTIPKKKSNDEN